MLGLLVGLLLGGAPARPDLGICSSEAQEVLRPMGTDIDKLRVYCSSEPASPATASAVLYDIASEKSDFAELMDDLRQGKGVGARVRFVLSSVTMGKFCLALDNFEGRSTLTCTAMDGTSVDVISADRATRLALTKRRDRPSEAMLVGRVLGVLGSRPVIEVARLGDK